VDITNYCLLEYGQPLHAFDYDKLEGGAVVVRRAREGEKIVLIDGLEKKLSSSVLVIADNKKALAIAGIMGGKDSEVTEATSCLMLESAYFDPIVVRRGTRALGVATDSSYRFERGVDGVTVKTAMDAAIAMIGTLCGGKLVVIKQAGDKKEVKTKDIIFNCAQARDILSIDVSPKESKTILEKLGFGVKQKGKGSLAVRIPSFRRDVRIEEDITEEIARVYGYEKIPLTTPEIKPFFLEIPKIELLKSHVKNTLVCAGLKEVVTYSLVSDEFYTKSAWKLSEKSLCLENPLSQEYRLLRTTLIPSLLDCAALNINRNNQNFEIFEVASVYDNGEERLSLGILLSGSRRATWQKDVKAYTIFDLKGICETLLHEAHIDVYDCQRTTEDWLNHIMVKEGVILASLAQVPDAIKRNWGIKSKEDIFVAEIHLGFLAQFAHFKKVFKPLSSTPSIQRDISVFAPEAVTFEAIKKLIAQKATGYLKAVGLIECYQGKEIPKGFTGLTVSCAYGSDTRTLSDAEINPVHQGVLDALVKELSLTLR
jgi:phenylalanyl-tRNA synthetase beta chain